MDDSWPVVFPSGRDDDVEQPRDAGIVGNEQNGDTDDPPIFGRVAEFFEERRVDTVRFVLDARESREPVAVLFFTHLLLF